MVNKIVILLVFVLTVYSCTPTESDGIPPDAPVLIDSTLFFSLNETGSGIRPDPNSSGIIIDWNQNPENKVTDYGLYRTNFNAEGVPYGFKMISKFSNSGVLSYVDTVNIGIDTLYFYKMTAFNADLESGFSNVVNYQLLEKPIINSPNVVIVDTANLKFTWTILGTSSNFVIKVREAKTRKYVWALLTQPETFDSEQSIPYGKKYIVSGSPKQSKEFYLPEKLSTINGKNEYEWKISLTTSFTINTSGIVSFKNGKGSSSAWTAFKTK